MELWEYRYGHTVDGMELWQYQYGHMVNSMELWQYWYGHMVDGMELWQYRYGQTDGVQCTLVWPVHEEVGLWVGVVRLLLIFIWTEDVEIPLTTNCTWERRRREKGSEEREGGGRRRRERGWRERRGEGDGRMRTGSNNWLHNRNILTPSSLTPCQSQLGSCQTHSLWVSTTYSPPLPFPPFHPPFPHSPPLPKTMATCHQFNYFWYAARAV